VILAFLLLVSWVAFPKTPGGALLQRPAEALPFLALLIIACGPVVRRIIRDSPGMGPLATERGLIYIAPGMSAHYQESIEFMKTAARAGEETLSVPEDVSLYFFSGTHSPTRVFSFTPGVVAPGNMMDELIGEIERKQVRYLIWSNRKFVEYGVPEFGVDFDQPLGDYFRSHFRPIASLRGRSEWFATIWERTAQRGPP
jgi:hypothetical protein